ncbi:M50 family metallopeptidase [Actinokineospora sp. UTMC 2448]|uniref:M50 family metallopeptidase n=1 Tax=Actinokineospora sp. UTMC 2448 TaxID=2268449 RepID=UPI002164A3AD|nr:M50 family metallopeptidase [Actinokineospora sp. UTMC 2448]UVS81933.1 hypothetical protein Actkin_05697 [Actinokineospora sp. UTMC 2448]
MTGRATAAESVRARFPARLVVEPADDGRFAVTDPRGRARWVLGGPVLDVARLFTGDGTYAEVAEAARSAGLRTATAQSMRAFEAKLLALGVLDDTARPSPARRALRVLTAVERVDVGAADPTRALDALLRRAPWLAGCGVAVLACLVSLAAVVALLARFAEFAAAVPDALRGWGLLGVLVVTVLSSVFHEGGHALACRAYGVPVRRVGIGLRSLAVFAWTEPDERVWSALPWRPRLVTVAAGLLGSLVYAAVGVALWLSGPLATLGVWLVLAGTVCVVPTLIPSFDGDAYLLLTCLPGMANLRSRSFAALRSRRWGVPTLGYAAFALITVLGRAAVAAFVLWLVWVCALAG